MKNKVLFSVVISLISLATWAQNVPNPSFESWVSVTNYLSLSVTTPPLMDTTISQNPDNWTTSNEITDGVVFDHKSLVSQSATSYLGSSAMQLRSDSLYAVINNVPVIGTINVNFVCPGFAVCGVFPINLSTFINLGTTFNPALLAGAGTRVNGRKASIGGYLKYTPVGGDTAYVIAVLRQGTTVVATAQYKRYTTDPNFSFFEVPFVYQNCLEPDTLVYTLSSGNPYSISNVAAGVQSGLHIGSTLLADSIFVSDTLVSFQVPPTVVDDVDTTFKNVAKTVTVTVNDNSCSGGALAVAVLTQPLHGTAVASGSNIVYTPATGFIGLDTFYYTATVGGSAPSSPGATRMAVLAPVGISDISEGQTKIYPNPASSKLYISTANTAITNVAIYDVLGKMVRTEAINSNLSIDLNNFNEGLYLVRFMGSEGKVISTARFSVVK